MTDDLRVLEISSVRYYSQLDEDHFFGWFSQIPCVLQAKGRGETLYVRVDAARVDEASFQELFALLRRYNVPVQQLAVLGSKKLLAQLREDNSWLYNAVFGAKT